MAERRRVDLTDVVRGEPQALIEFEFHPLGLPGWVAVFDCILEVPWAEEALLEPNRSYSADRLRAESSIVARRAEAAFPLRQRAFAAQPYMPPSSDRVQSGELRALAGGFIAFDPYDGGFMNRRVPLADGCLIALTHNGAEENVDASAVVGGDDVSLTIRDGRAERIAARRGSTTGPVIVFEPATPFRLPLLRVADAPAMPNRQPGRAQGAHHRPQARLLPGPHRFTRFSARRCGLNPLESAHQPNNRRRTGLAMTERMGFRTGCLLDKAKRLLASLRPGTDTLRAHLIPLESVAESAQMSFRTARGPFETPTPCSSHTTRHGSCSTLLWIGLSRSARPGGSASRSAAP